MNVDVRGKVRRRRGESFEFLERSYEMASSCSRWRLEFVRREWNVYRDRDRTCIYSVVKNGSMNNDDQ